MTLFGKWSKMLNLPLGEDEVGVGSGVAVLVGAADGVAFGAGVVAAADGVAFGAGVVAAADGVVDEETGGQETGGQETGGQETGRQETGEQETGGQGQIGNSSGLKYINVG